VDTDYGSDSVGCLRDCRSVYRHVEMNQIGERAMCKCVVNPHTLRARALLLEQDIDAAISSLCLTDTEATAFREKVAEMARTTTMDAFKAIAILRDRYARGY
jgi:hypothetical protein